MPKLRLRSAGPAVLLLALLLTLSACGMNDYPNSTFNHTTDYNTAIDALWDRLLWWGTLVFIVVESVLVFTIIKFRKRPGGPEAKQIHGNAALEITWTVIPALILALIAIPTIKTIFETQAPAPAGSLRVQVIGHQWWWEFRYPDLGVVTANEVYVPVGRTISFELTTKDVLHSFWIPQMGGKRDLITNRTNYMWFTPSDTLKSSAWNGFCTEYCGASHANMRIRMYTVQPDEFESWARHQASPASFKPYTPPAPAPPVARDRRVAAAPVDTTPALPSGYVFPTEQLPAHVIPNTPIPAGIEYDDALLASGDPLNGARLFGAWRVDSLGAATGGCFACHAIGGVAWATGNVGPNLTHVASRHTIAGGLYRNDAPTLARWIKNARHMKPGAIMNTIGKGQYDPIMKTTVTAGLDDRQIADVVAYLMSLK